jgi:hypothetical protein
MPNIEIEMVQPVALVSVSMSALVVLTAIIFPQMIYRRIFMQLIVSISAADILGNWTYCLGSNPPGHSFLCAFEGFCNLFFFPVGWILTMFLTLLFRDLLTKGKIFYSRPLIFGASLLVPLFFTLLYLAFTQYTTDDDEGLHPCTFGSGAQLYHQITYDGMIGVCLIVMFGLMVATFKYEYDNPARAKLQTYKLVRKIITLYPIALIVCWAPHSICIVFQECNDNLHAQLITSILKIAHGGLVAIIFFSVSKDARNKWYNLLAFIICCGRRVPGPPTIHDKLVSSTSLSSYPSIDDEGSLPQDGDLASLLTTSNLNQHARQSGGIFGADLDLNDEFSEPSTYGSGKTHSTGKSLSTSTTGSTTLKIIKPLI